MKSKQEVRATVAIRRLMATAGKQCVYTNKLVNEFKRTVKCYVTYRNPVVDVHLTKSIRSLLTECGVVFKIRGGKPTLSCHNWDSIIVEVPVDAVIAVDCVKRAQQELSNRL